MVEFAWKNKNKTLVFTVEEGSGVAGYLISSHFTLDTQGIEALTDWSAKELYFNRAL